MAASTGDDTLTRSTGLTAVAIAGLFGQWLRGLTINAHERLALVHLWEHGPMTMSELGARIPLSRAAVTALTDRLEALDFVRRTPDAHDRRRTVLSLTDRPRRLVEPLAGEWLAQMERLEATFDERDRAAVARWNHALRELCHQHATVLRRRSDDELPSAGSTGAAGAVHP